MDRELSLPDRLALSGVFSLLWFIASAAETRAQFGNRHEAMAQERILLAPRPLSRLLREGAAALEQMRYSDAIESLGSLLLEEQQGELDGDSLQQDYFTEAAGDRYFRSSVRSEALRLLGGIPEEGRKFLEIKYGVAARKALTTAVASRDIDAISEVSRKYYHTQAGYDASVLLSQDKLIRGFPIAAAGILQRLSGFSAARMRFGAQLFSEVAGAWMQAGRTDLAVKALQDGATYFPGGTVSLGSRQVTLDSQQDWPKVLGEVYPKLQQLGERPVENWLMTGGQPDRNGTAAAGLPMPMVAWDMTLHRDRSDEETVAMLAQRSGPSTAALLPKLEARMLGDIVLAKTATSNIFAIDLETGLRKWPFYKDALPVSLAPRNQAFALESEEFLLHTNLRNRIWGSSAFGQFSIDNLQLYYITGTEDIRTLRQNLGLTFHSAPASNTLIGVSLQGEGKELWQVGGEASLNEPKLAGAYFLGPPLSFEGELYALAEINMETRLVVLDARSGKQKWSQQLTLTPDGSIKSDQLRQSQALSPSISDEVVVCPVGNGAIVAVDLMTRSLLWAKQYHAPTQPLNPFGGLNEPVEAFDATVERWSEPQVMVHRGRVIFTPPEYNHILCIDLLTGATHWEQVRDARYVAGIHNNRVIMVSNTDVHALNLTDGMASWGANVLVAAELPNSAKRATELNSSDAGGMRQREVVAGKGVRDGSHLYLPTTARRVLKIDLDEGKLVDAALVEQPLGNLFAFKNRIISVGATRITAYYTRESLAEQVQQRLAANAEDIWALNQRALLLLADNNVNDAIEMLRKSFTLDSENGETRYLLVDALLAGLERDFDRYLPLATEYESIIKSQYFRFLVLLAKGNIKSGQHELAFGRLMQLVGERTHSRQPGLQPRAQTMSLAVGHQVDIDTWIGVQLARVFQAAAPEQRQRMLLTIGERLAAASQNHPLTRELELRFLAWLDPAHESILQLAANLLGDADQVMAERLLQPVLFDSRSEMREQALSLLRQNAKADDLVMLPSYEDRMVDPWLGPTGGQKHTPPPVPQWPTGMVLADVKRGEAPVSPTQIRLRATGTRYGRPEIELGFANDHLIISNTYGSIVAQCAFQRSTGDLNDSFLRVQYDGGLVYLETQTELLAFDLYRGYSSSQDSCLWRYSLSRVPANPQKPFASATSTVSTNPLRMKTPCRGSSTREALVGPMTPVGVVVQKEGDVILLDAQTGNPVWSRSNYDDSTALVAHELEVAVVHKSTKKIDILDCRDGSLLRQYDYDADWASGISSGQHLVQTKVKKGSAKKSAIQVDNSEADQCRLRLLNVFSGQVVLETEFASLSAGRDSGRHLAVVEPTGRLWYCDVQTAKVVEHKLPPQKGLRDVCVQLFGPRLVIWTNLADSNSMRIRPWPDDKDNDRGIYPINGSIVGLDANDGQLLWEQAGQLQLFVYNSSQPRNSPFIAFYRIQQATSQARQAGLAVIDLRDGTLAYGNTQLEVRSQAGERAEFTMLIEPSRQEVHMGIGSTRIELSPTHQERPPQPVCHFGALKPINNSLDLPPQ